MSEPQQETCPKCGKSVRTTHAHYVPSVGHLTTPQDAILPYWTCQGVSE